MKDILTPEIYSNNSSPSTVTDAIENRFSEWPYILYLELRRGDIFYSICSLVDVNSTLSKPLRKENLKMVISTMHKKVKGVIVESDSTSLDLLYLLLDACNRFCHVQKIPFIMFESASTKFLLAKENMPGSIDDVVSREISINDLDCKIRVLTKLKHEKVCLVNAASKKDINSSSGGARSMSGLVKRIIDLFVASILLVLLSPIMLLIAVAIKMTSKGPIIYKAERSGRNYKIFRFIKFRSMYLDADKKLEEMMSRNQYAAENNGNPVFFKMSDDPRITPIGRVLRNTSLDELPQLFNVLRGEMSLVGNRPLPLYEAKTLTTDDCVERFNAPAGITGLWQVKKRGAKEMSVRERIDLDIKYARNYTLIYDMRIMLQTPKALIQKDNV